MGVVDVVFCDFVIGVVLELRMRALGADAGVDVGAAALTLAW